MLFNSSQNIVGTLKKLNLEDVVFKVQTLKEPDKNLTDRFDYDSFQDVMGYVGVDLKQEHENIFENSQHTNEKHIDLAVNNTNSFNTKDVFNKVRPQSLSNILIKNKILEIGITINSKRNKTQIRGERCCVILLIGIRTNYYKFDGKKYKKFGNEKIISKFML
jgi:hypothetical protein